MGSGHGRPCGRSDAPAEVRPRPLRRRPRQRVPYGPPSRRGLGRTLRENVVGVPANCEQVVVAFGRTRDVTDFRPDDFGRLRAKAAKRHGSFALAKFVQMVRTLFAFGYENGQLNVPIKYGSQFEKPPVRVLRLQRRAGAAKFPSPADCWRLLDAAEDRDTVAIEEFSPMPGLVVTLGSMTQCTSRKRAARTLGHFFSFGGGAAPRAGVAGTGWNFSNSAASL
jgi:hypothetical protein